RCAERGRPSFSGSSRYSSRHARRARGRLQAGQSEPRPPRLRGRSSSHVEPTALSPRPPTTSGITPTGPTMLFSAWLVVFDGQNTPRAQLAERLPELGTPDWQVFPDGQMETTYRLRPDLTWHDGTPLTAEDAVFGWEVFTWPEMGVPMDPPIRLIQGMTAPDAR